MDIIITRFGEVLTDFLKTISGLWEWLFEPQSIFGWQIMPISIFGASFLIVLGFVFVKSIIF